MRNDCYILIGLNVVQMLDLLEHVTTDTLIAPRHPLITSTFTR